MLSPKIKIVQKRNKKKQRYAKMLRKRDRTLNNIPCAQFTSLQAPEDLNDETKVTHLPMGIFVGEKNGKSNYDLSILNKTHHTNYVKTSFEGDRVVTIKLQDKAMRHHALKSGLSSPIKEEKEFTSSPPSKEEGIKQMAEEFQNLLFKKNEQLMNGNLNDESIKKYNNYLSQRKQLLTTRACLEIKRKFDRYRSVSIEISYNSKFLALSDYEFDEYLDVVLKSGLPVMSCGVRRNGLEYDPRSKIMNLIASFERPQVVTNLESMHITKDHKMKKIKLISMLYGNFTKHGAELTSIICLDQVDSIPKTLNMNAPISMVSHKFQLLNIKERREFLKKYYPHDYAELNSKFLISTSTTPQSYSEQFSLKEEDDLTQNKLEEIKTETKLETESSDNSLQSNQYHNSKISYYNTESLFTSISPQTYLNVLNTLYQSYRS